MKIIQNYLFKSSQCNNSQISELWTSITKRLSQHTMVIQFIEQNISSKPGIFLYCWFATHNLNDFEIFVAESFASSSLSERHISSAENQNNSLEPKVQKT